MTFPATFAIWLVLILLLGIEFFIRGAVAMAIGVTMATTVALTYMRLARTKDIASAFALAAVFWLMVLLGLGSMDSATRHDVSISVVIER